MRRMRSRKKSGRLFTVLAVILIFAAISYKQVSLDTKEARLLRQKEELMRQVERLEEEKKRIEDYASYMQTPKYIEDTAREKLGLVYPDEIIFSPKDE